MPYQPNIGKALTLGNFKLIIKHFLAKLMDYSKFF